MKQIFKYIYLSVLACSTMLSLNSCLGTDEENKGTSECAILSFAVDDIKSAITIKNSLGEDSVYYRTMSGSSIKFNIDQIRGLITTVDSLPNWLDITRVVPTYSGYGYAYVRVNDIYYAFSNGKDSLDFTNGLDLMMVSTDGTSAKKYTVTINKSSNDADTLVWEALPQNNLVLNGNHRLVARNGNMFVFAENGGNTTLTTSLNGTEWTSPSVLNSQVDPNSVTLFRNDFYALDAEGQILSSADGLQWNKVSDMHAEQILASDAAYLYIQTGGKILASKDMAQWKENGIVDTEMLPQSNICSRAYTTRTNSQLQNVVMIGTSPSDTENSVVWFKISSDDESSNQTWNYIPHKTGNAYTLPHADELSLVYYEGELLAFVADYAAGTHSLYSSEDNGITWHKNTEHVLPPSDLATTEPSSFILLDNNAWVIQGGEQPKVWKGTLKTVK